MKERDYHHKKALTTSKELHWSNHKRLRNTINTRMHKEKSDYYLINNKSAGGWTRPKGDVATLHKIFPKNIKSVPSISSDVLTVSSFNGFFTSIASALCSHFNRCSTVALPKVFTPRVKHDFVQKCPPVLYKKNCSKWSKLKLLDTMEFLLGYWRMQQMNYLEPLPTS